MTGTRFFLLTQSGKAGLPLLCSAAPPALQSSVLPSCALLLDVFFSQAAEYLSRKEGGQTA